MEFIKIKILERNPGKWNVSYKVGQVVNVEKKQATELIEAGAAELVKIPKAKKIKK